MRHKATIEFLKGISVHEKLQFFNNISTTEGLQYNDITSANEDEVITAYFSTEKGEKGRIVFQQSKMEVSVKFSFDNLVSLVSFINTSYADNILDPLRAETDDNYPPVENNEPIETA